MRVVAILAAYNEERFIGGCLEHLFEQGVEAYLIDNSSTDSTVKIAERYRDRGLIGVESFPRDEGVYRWRKILERKEEIALELEADWFMHLDPDEIRVPHRSGQTLAEAFAEVDEKGYNAVNFLESTFVPTAESPDHDRPDFQKTMRWYYPYMQVFPSQVKAWKKQPARVNLARVGGHRVLFPGALIYPESFKMRHYPFLSVSHFVEKYLDRTYDSAELERGWHGGWRTSLAEEKIELPSEEALYTYTSDGELDFSNPRTRHVAEDWSLLQKPEGQAVSSPLAIPEPDAKPDNAPRSSKGAKAVSAPRSGLSGRRRGGSQRRRSVFSCRRGSRPTGAGSRRLHGSPIRRPGDGRRPQAQEGLQVHRPAVGPRHAQLPSDGQRAHRRTRPRRSRP